MSKKEIKNRRDFPAVEEILQNKKLKKYLDILPRPLIAETVKEVVAQTKKEFGEKKLFESDLYNNIVKSLDQAKRSEITKVIKNILLFISLIRNIRI